MGKARLVRGEDHVVEREKRALDERLGLEHIEPGAGDPAVRQRLDTGPSSSISSPRAMLIR